MSEEDALRVQRAQASPFPMSLVAVVLLAAIIGVVYNIGGISMVVDMTFPLVILTFMILAVVGALPGGERADER